MNKKQIAFGTGFALLIGIVVWYYVASNNLSKLASAAQNAMSRINNERSSFIDRGAPKNEIKFDDVSKYCKSYVDTKSELLQIKNDLLNGNGLGIWFPNAREEEAASIVSFLIAEDTTHSLVVIALNSTASIHEEFLTRLSASSEVRKRAVAVLNATSDAGEFKTGRKDLTSISKDLIALKSKVDVSRKTKLPNLTSENVRIGVLKTMAREISEENITVKQRTQSLISAEKLLSNYKAQTNRIISSQSGMARTLNTLANDFYPVTASAKEKVEPIRSMISELEKPIFNDNLVSGIGSFLGGSSGEPLSAMSLISSVDPSTASMIELVKSTCDGIGDAEEEIRGIIDATRPFLENSDDFKNTRSRTTMRTLLQSTQQLSSYYESKRSVFDPITNKLDEARDGVSRLNSVADQIRISGARNLIYRVTGLAQEVLSIAYSPFHRWQQVVTNTTESMNQLDSYERQYVEALNKLRTDQFDINEINASISKGYSDDYKTEPATIPSSNSETQQTSHENTLKGFTASSKVSGTVEVNAYKECWVMLISKQEVGSAQYGWWSVWRDRKNSGGYYTTPHTFTDVVAGKYTLVVYDPASSGYDPNSGRSSEKSDGVVIEELTVGGGGAQNYNFKQTEFKDWNCLSCPWVYTFDGKKYIKRAEILKDLIGRDSKTGDSILLPSSCVIDRKVRIKLSEERDEVTHIDCVSLLVGGTLLEPFVDGELSSVLFGNDNACLILRKGDVAYIEFKLPSTLSDIDLIVFRADGYYEPDPVALQSYVNSLGKK